MGHLRNDFLYMKVLGLFLGGSPLMRADAGISSSWADVSSCLMCMIDGLWMRSHARTFSRIIILRDASYQDTKAVDG